MPDLVPLEQAALEAGLARSTLFRYAAAGRLTKYRLPRDRKTYVDRAELDKLIRDKPKLYRKGD